MDCLAWLRNIAIVGVQEIGKYKLYDYSNSGSGLQLYSVFTWGEEWYMCFARMVSLVKMVCKLHRLEWYKFSQNGKH